MTLDELKTQWALDCPIDDNLGNAAVGIPMLHSRYLDELVNTRLKAIKISHEISELKAAKGRYFRGEMTKSELDERGWTQWQYKSLKADIPELIEADPDFQKIQSREAYLKTVIYFLESVMGEIKNRNWAIRAAIDYRKFMAGA
jgi:predicted restriction endonuclease